MKEKEHNVRLGIFVFAGLALLIFGLYSIGKNKNLFGKSFTITAVFHDVNGLIEGNNVRFAGIDIGTVDKIEILNDSTVKVEMVIDQETQKFIRKNAVASVGTDGLMGNKLISITPGTADSPVIANGEQISSLQAIDTEEMLRTLNTTNVNISVISSNLRTITENVNKSRGALYTVLTDTSLAHQIGNSISNIQTVSSNLISVTKELEGVIRNISHGKGTIGMLMSDTSVAGDLRLSISRIREGSEQVSRITKDVGTMLNEVNNGKGTVNTLLKDSVMAGDLRTTISNLEKASSTMNEELEALKNSFLLRPFYKHQKKNKSN